MSHAQSHPISLDPFHHESGGGTRFDTFTSRWQTRFYSPEQHTIWNVPFDQRNFAKSAFRPCFVSVHFSHASHIQPPASGKQQQRRRRDDDVSQSHVTSRPPNHVIMTSPLGHIACTSAHTRQGHSAPIMGLAYVYGCVHTEVHVHHHDRRWFPTRAARMVRGALAHAVWPRGNWPLANT